MVERVYDPFGKRGLFTMLRWQEELAGYQLVGEVTAHQGDDGYGV
jgi:hypothetical protein